MRICTALAMAVALAAITSSQISAADSDSTINVSASAFVKVLPTRYRLQTQLFGSGETAEKALNDLKAKREYATKQLKSVKADTRSILFGVPRLESPVPALQAVPAQTVIVPGPSFSAIPAPTYSPRPTYQPGQFSPPTLGPVVPDTTTTAPAHPAKKIVASTLMVEWPIDDRNPDNILLQGETIQQKVLAADPWGDKQKSTESSVLVGASGTFFYVSVLSEASRKSALARACQQAEKNATLLAEAAKVRVGPLEAIGTQCDGSGQIGWAVSPAPFLNQPARQPTEVEAVSTSPDPLGFNVSVMARYRLIHPGDKK